MYDELVCDRRFRIFNVVDDFSRDVLVIEIELNIPAQCIVLLLEFIKSGKPTQNAFIERFNPIYRTEILDFYLFKTLNEARKITEHWLTKYNSQRPHESLNNLASEEYRLMAEKPEISKSVWN